ncbi:hypothetical protein HN681_01100 [archaeon]|jgi:hypothetical protein|nr:hypothetical protein [archaeon]MBT3730610.1 hypothetical protein [archaeon]MBT4669512.1 hypothetical protein [archaeon]MBT5030269.1 hypothetical protein [archaeon]MBT5287632.1 hypothetical protein [archaeon]
MKIEDRIAELADDHVYFDFSSLGNTGNLLDGRIIHRFEDDKGLEYVFQECPVSEIDSRLYSGTHNNYLESVFDKLKAQGEIEINLDDLPYMGFEQILEKHSILDSGLDLVYDFYLIDLQALKKYIEKHSE